MVTKTVPGQLGIAAPFWELLGASDADMMAEFADYARLGADWIRTDFLWSHVQPAADGAYDWSKLDRVVAAAEQYGIAVVGVMHGVPSWAQASGGMANAANQSAFAAFAGAAEQRYLQKVDHWEIWNEPNTRLFWGDAPPDAAAYAGTLKAAYTAIKSVSPDDTVISGGLAPMAETATGNYVRAEDFLNGVYLSGGKGYFDAVGFHPYTWPRLPDDPAPDTGWDQMEKGIRATMTANGDDGLQVWMTEFGSPTKGSSGTETSQAQTLRIATDLAHATPWAGPIMWYSYQDRGGLASDAENWFGLLRPDGSQKPAYSAFQSIALCDGGPGEPLAPPVTPITGTNRNETLKGTDGRDILYGGGGKDTLTGHGDSDLFVYRALSDAGDRITDFSVLQGDRIDLSAVLGGGGDSYADLLAAGYLALQNVRGGVRVLVDQDGGGDGYVTMATLSGVTADMLDDHSVIVSAMI